MVAVIFGDDARAGAARPPRARSARSPVPPPSGVATRRCTIGAFGTPGRSPRAESRSSRAAGSASSKTPSPGFASGSGCL